jgi:two-component system cell cycle sensor histidine kinase/response regulator CckA
MPLDISILIVEDSDAVAMSTRDMLGLLSYQVAGRAASGEEALRLAKTRHPDLALMDIRLKGAMDGIGTAQRLHARFNIPVIYVTAHADAATLERAIETQPFGYLIKPFTDRELQSVIEMALFKQRSEKKLKAHAARLQKVIATVPQGVAMLDPDRRLMLANAKAREYLEVLASAAVGDVIDHLGDKPLAILQGRSEPEAWFEIEMPGPPSRVFEANVSSVLSEPNGSGGAPSEWVLVIREITAERQMRHRAQQQDRLATVGQFAAGVAHDFGNLLGSMTSISELIQLSEPDLSPKTREHLDTLVRQAERASSLIRQVLDFGRLSDIKMEPVDLLLLFQDLVIMLESMLPKNIRLKAYHRSRQFVVAGDENRLLQVLMNLALNARDAMPNGGVLYIDLEQVGGQELPVKGLPNQEKWIRIRVVDDGTGIPPDVLPHIFEPFFTTKEAGKGTGLGLAQVYGIVQEHDGYINVDSKLGKGTAFTLYFPAVMSSSPVNEVVNSEVVAPWIENGRTKQYMENGAPAVNVIPG